jgi:hypothetical protein
MTRASIVATTFAIAAAVSLGSARSPEGARAESIGPDTSTARVLVLNTQLRGIIDPEIMPTDAWGHLQVKLTEADDGTWVPEWNGRLYNPESQEFITGLVVELDGEGGDSVPFEGGEILVGSVVLDLFRGASASCGIIDFESQAITDEEHMPADTAQRMMIDPDLFGVLLLSTDGPIVFGRFGPGDPEPVSGSGLTGKPVRCSASD